MAPPKLRAVLFARESVAVPQESDLVDGFIRGDRNAISSVFRAHGSAVAGFVARLGVHRDDIEDLVQSTFAEAIRVAPSFRAESSLRTWLLSIALNLSRAYIRGRIRARKGSELIEQTLPDIDVFDRSESPEGELASAQRVDRLRRALDELPELQREALLLCEIEDLSAKEVSEITGAPPSTIWRRVHDAKVSLRKIFRVPSGTSREQP
ncbi:MAG: RNA polymerase sigma factor [Polyangiaceae bacterium]